MAPAFDINPFPDKGRESKIWLSEETGPVTELGPLLDSSAYFRLNAKQALAALVPIYNAVRSWRTVALSPAVGLTAAELKDFAPAFEHAAMDDARCALGGEPS